MTQQQKDELMYELIREMLRQQHEEETKPEIKQSIIHKSMLATLVKQIKSLLKNGKC
jgi:hypothetical protein